MASESLEELDLEIKRLERDKRVAEIRQLQSSRRTQWITPAALAALVPIAVLVFGEAKKFNAGYRALDELEQIRKQKEDLQQQQSGLSQEITMLLGLKQHYAEQAKDMQERFEKSQAQLDTTYLRAVFASAESTYALSHIEGMGPGPDPAALDGLKTASAALPDDSRETLANLLQRYELAVDMIDVTQDTLAAFSKTLEILPVSDWARELQAAPSGYFIPNRNIMATTDEKQWYDVDAGRLLTAEEMVRR